MGRKRRERTKPEKEGEARNGGGNPSPGPRTTRSPAQDLGAAVATVTVEERRGRQIWGRRAAKLLGAAGGRSGGGGAAIRPCMGSHRRLSREGRGGAVVEEGVVASPVEEGVAAATVEERRGWPLRDLGATGVRAWSRAGAGGAFGIGMGGRVWR